MSKISYSRTGIIKKVNKTTIMVEMTDSGERFTWPLHSNNEANDTHQTPAAGEEVTIKMQINDEPLQKKHEIQEAETERMRKMLEEILN